LMAFGNDNAYPGELDPSVEKYTKLIAENEQFAVGNPALPLLSSTFMEKGKQLDQIIFDARTKFIMGEINEQDFAAAIENWQQQGGNKIMEEYKQEYEKLQ